MVSLCKNYVRASNILHNLFFSSSLCWQKLWSQATELIFLNFNSNFQIIIFGMFCKYSKICLSLLLLKSNTMVLFHSISFKDYSFLEKIWIKISEFITLRLKAWPQQTTVWTTPFFLWIKVFNLIFQCLGKNCWRD